MLRRAIHRADTHNEIVDGGPDRDSGGELASWWDPDESRIGPWGVQSVDHVDIDFWQGRLADDLVDTAITALVDELQ